MMQNLFEKEKPILLSLIKQYTIAQNTITSKIEVRGKKLALAANCGLDGINKNVNGDIQQDLSQTQSWTDNEFVSIVKGVLQHG